MFKVKKKLNIYLIAQRDDLCVKSNEKKEGKVYEKTIKENGRSLCKKFNK